MAQTLTRAMLKTSFFDTIQCPLCIAAFKSPVALQAHAVYSHRAGFFTCAWCSKIIETESKIEEHAKSCTESAKCEEDEFEAFCIVGSYCDICESSFPSDIRAIKHYKEIHLHCTYICGICVKHFHRKENFDLHCADKHSDENQSCQMEKPKISERSIDDKKKLSMEFNEKRCIDCQISFESIADIRKHFRMEHQFEMHLCMKCEKGYTSKSSKDHHLCYPPNNTLLRISDDSVSYKMKLMKEFNEGRCFDCKINNFASVTEISEHFRTKHFDVHLCQKCSRGFMHKSTLAKHQCYRNVSQSDRMHMLKDLQDKRCSHCDSTFTNHADGVEHFLERHQFKIFVCEKCGKATPSEGKLKYHFCRPRQRTKAKQEHRRSREKSVNISPKKEKRNAASVGSDASSSQQNATETIKQRADARVFLKERDIDEVFVGNGRSTLNESTSREASNSSSGGKKHSCCLCPYDMPTFEMGLNHYAEEHDILIFECPAPHCFQLFRRFSKWSRHFVKFHGNVELPVNSDFRKLLDEIMEQVYKKVMAESLIFAREKIYENNNSLDASTKHFEQTIHNEALDDISSGIGSKPMPSNSGKRGETILTDSTSPVVAKATPSIPTFILTDTESETEPASNSDTKTDTDSDVEILEWIPGTDVKPVIKLENNLNWE